jgi:2-polyprenyl-6-methoxyphenol hydroxylase-like FAD-dependent oxidoreductase
MTMLHSSATTDHPTYSVGTRQALVIGGGIAGLLAARVLTDHFDRVTIVERDHLPTAATFRSGVPQSRHVHALLLRGRQIMEQLFPGLEAELEAAGVPIFDQGLSGLTLFKSGWTPRIASGLTVYACSRTLLESHIRERLIANRNVTLLHGCSVIGLTATGNMVTGVQLRQRAHQLGATSDVVAEDVVLNADFVIDASGRGSDVTAWLDALGYGTADKTTVNAFLGYATCWFQRPAGFEAPWQAMMINT